MSLRRLQSNNTQTFLKKGRFCYGVARLPFGWYSIGNESGGNDEPFFGEVLQVVETDNFWVLSRSGFPPPEPYGTDSFRFLDDGASGCTIEDEGVYWDGATWRIETLRQDNEGWVAQYVKTSQTQSPFGFYELDSVISGVPPSIVIVSEYTP